MAQKYLIFLAIILGSVMIGGCIYIGIINSTLNIKNSSNILPLQTDQPPSVTQSTVLCNMADNIVVTKIIDGDTVVVSGGEHIRLLGIDADEKEYPCYIPAKKRLEELVLNKTVRLERDVTNTDQYGRCLRYLYLDDKNINMMLVEEGFAVARFYAPNLKYKKEIGAAETLALRDAVGCKWQK